MKIGPFRPARTPQKRLQNVYKIDIIVRKTYTNNLENFAS